MEEFRPLLVERLTVEVFRQRVIRSQDFRAGGPTGGVLFSDAARRRLLDRWEHQLLRPVLHRASGRKVTYRRAIELQARLLASAITRDAVTYSAMTWR
jgi:CRISP-associated protein Cas1